MKRDRYLDALDSMEREALTDLNGHLDGDGPYKDQGEPSKQPRRRASEDGVTIIVGGAPLGVVEGADEDDEQRRRK